MSVGRGGSQKFFLAQCATYRAILHVSVISTIVDYAVERVCDVNVLDRPVVAIDSQHGNELISRSHALSDKHGRVV